MNFKFRNVTKTFFYLIIFFVISIIFLGSLINIYKSRNSILQSIGKIVGDHEGHMGADKAINPLKKSNRQIAPQNINDLIINPGAEVKGQWTAPVDWNVIPLHAALLPDETVMTYGSYSIHKKEGDKDLRANKTITINDGNKFKDGRKFDRDGGSHQWEGHWVYSAIDIDVWDPKKGVGDESHILFKQPVVMDSFCSILRVLDLNRVFIVGGNKNIHKPDMPDTQNKTMIYDLRTKKFTLSKNLNYKRWYGSIVITGDNKMYIFGGKDIVSNEPSIVPEMIDLKNIDNGWQALDQSASNIFFGNEIQYADEWSYPRAYLTSDGNIVGISYNKIWVMDIKNNHRVFKTAEIPLVEGGVSNIIEFKNPNSDGKHKENLQLLTIGSPVGSTNSTVMIEKDKVLIFGGKQAGKEYTSSNKVMLVDFSNSLKPKLLEFKNMKYARNNANITTLPDGNIFINGGSSYNKDDFKFSILTPEIYNPKNQSSIEMEKAYFRRNYHSASLLLADGRVWTGGGDVWNGEIFYPPYLFTRDLNNKTVLAKRPEILEIDKEIKRGVTTKIKIEGTDISRVTLLSTGSTTHAQASESKFRELDFTLVSNNEINIQLNKNPNDIQNGTYMVFVINSKGVPSEGKIVYVN